MNFNTPVVYYIFIRPDISLIVFNRIKEIKPKDLVLVSDGPRNKHEKSIIEKNRKQILELVDWNCNLKPYFFENNNGIDKIWHLSFNYVFEHFDKAIFLEEDILPEKSFFHYCEELLSYYEDDKSVFMITGINALESYPLNQTPSYFFTNANSTWGFAMWKRSFDALDKNLNLVKDPYYAPVIKEYFRSKKSKKAVKAYKKIMRISHNKELIEKYKNEISEVWFVDYNPYLLYNMLTIVPSVNLIMNLGNVAGSENSDYDRLITKRMKRAFKMNSFEIKLPLNHPKYKIVDYHYKLRIRSKNKQTFMSNIFDRIDRGIRILIFAGPKEFAIKLKKFIIRTIDFR